MKNSNSAVKHDELALCNLAILEYPGGSVAEVQPMYKKALHSSVLPLISSPCDAFEVFQEIWTKDRFQYCEQVYALFVNGSHHVHAWSLLAEGSVNHCQIYPQKVLTLALLTNSAGFIIAHNHPSGSTLISHNDKSFTEQIVKAAKYVGLSCLDHLLFSSLDEKPVSIRGAYPHLFEPKAI